MQGREEITMEEMRKSIDALKSYGIGQKLIDRMNINYNIILCEVYMFQKNYPAKDNCLKYIQSNYYKIPLTDADRVSLALYLSQYSKFDWAIKVVEPKVRKIDADEDLVFYYLNLTLNNTKIINSENYKIVVLNAANANKKRFCKIFDAPMADGISFQLLENEGLKKVYCEQCQGD